MHIPDGFLDAKTALITTGLACVGLSLALRQVRRELPPHRIPLLGLSAAFLFAAQMINFPVAGGTSGHLIGSVLIAALLGPSAAVVVVAAVLIVQCMLFADGGVLALGANLFNMGLAATLSGYALYRIAEKLLPGKRGRVVALALAAWCSTVVTAIVCAGELAWSGTVAWRVAFPAMTGVHMVIGIGEGLITALVFTVIARTRPELLAGDAQANADAPPRRSVRETVALGLLVSFGLIIFITPFASPLPDGLESVAQRLGFAEQARDPLLPALASEYHFPSFASAGVSTATAGIIGAVAVFLLIFIVGYLSVKPSARDQYIDSVDTRITHAPAEWRGVLKVLCAIGFILFITLTPMTRSAWFAAQAGVLLCVLIINRVPPLGLLKRLLLLSPFIAGVAFAAAYGGQGMDWKLLALRSTLCLITVIALAQTTPFGELLGAFRTLRAPALLITTLALMHRYLFVLSSESSRMRRARAARTFTESKRIAWRSSASIVGLLFVRAAERAGRIYDAMCARGWRT